jgi:hypothetical protein
MLITEGSIQSLMRLSPTETLIAKLQMGSLKDVKPRGELNFLSMLITKGSLQSLMQSSPSDTL